MSDDLDLDDLKSAMTAATPRPDPDKRAETLALAQKNFESLQGSNTAARPTPVTAPSGLFAGLKTMLTSLTSRGGLTVTTAIVACGFLFMTETGQGMWRESDFKLATDVGQDLPVGPMPDQITADQSNTGGAALPVEEETLDIAAVETSEAALSETALAEPVAEDYVLTLEATMDQDQATHSGLEMPGDVTTQPRNPVPAPNAARTRNSAPSPAPSAAPARSQVAPVTANEAFQGSDVQPAPTRDTEAFANEPPSALMITQENPVSTFSIDVDTASYAVMRSSLSRGQLPPVNAIRIEELINYFPYDYPAPDVGGAPFRPTVSTMQTPWNADTQLVHIAIQGQMPAIADRPPLNLVFLIDTSGSMNEPAKLPLLKQSFRLMLGQLRPEDEVAIVEYAGSAGQVLAPTATSDQQAILAAINSLGAGGSTNGQGGLQQAYAVADQMSVEGEVSRVILATDGDFNVGINDPDALKDFIADKRDTGTYLSVLGFGRGNLDDATMQALAQNGNGTAAYIDTLSEAQKVLVDQLTGALFPIAGDVKIQVEWNPAQIAEYRLIGYETRALAREDFNNDRVDAGELGAGHTVTAIYEVTPVGSPAQLSDPLRYGVAQVTETSSELGFLKLRYKTPGESESNLLTSPIVPTEGASSDAQFAAAIAGFGQLLRDPRFLGDWNFGDAINLANAHRGDDPFGYRTEAVQLMRLASSLRGTPMRSVAPNAMDTGTSR